MMFLLFTLGRKRPHDLSAAYPRDGKRRKRRRTGKDIDCSHNSEPYDVDAHVSQQSQPEPWLEELGLSKDEEKSLNIGKWLNDTLIDAGQKLLQQQFGDRIKGLHNLHLT